MAQSFFIWNGTDCRSKGIIMRGPASIIRPEERVTHVEIPGRAGDLTQTEGENIFNSYIQTVTISVRGGFRVREAYKWLRGAGYVTFSGEPDRRQKARVIGAITLDRVSRNLDNWTGEVQFYCQPVKEKLADKPIEITSSNTTIRNEGDVTAYPLYNVTASGSSITLTVTDTIGVGALNSITLTNTTSGHTYTIDSEIMEVTESGTKLTKYSSGQFPLLHQGDNTVTFSNVSKVEITKRERFL